MADELSLTLNEAGYVVGQSSDAINRVVDRGLMKAPLQPGGKVRLRMVGPVELRYLALVAEVEKDLTPAGRRKVYDAMQRLPPDASHVELGAIELRLTDVDARISQRLQNLADLKAAIVEGADSTPVIRGTSASVYAVAALTRGQTEAEILEDYPGLTKDDVRAAVEYAEVYPRAGRPLPSRSFKRALIDMAKAGGWDAEDDEPLAPRLIP